jgi:hypothetical protein
MLGGVDEQDIVGLLACPRSWLRRVLSDNQSTVDHAANLLGELLTEAKPKKEIDQWAKAQMISAATLRRAKDKNGHIAEKRMDGWYWLPLRLGLRKMVWLRIEFENYISDAIDPREEKAK